MSYIAIIPARSGSKGIKDKNLKLVGNHSLVARAVLSAQKIDKIDCVIVSTDSDRIADEAKKYGAKVHRRSKNSATDGAKTIEVIKEIYKDYQFTNEICILLQPTSPLRTSNDIVNSILQYEENKQQGSVVTVTECEHHPYKSLIITNNGTYKPIRSFEDLEQPRQNLNKAFRVNGAVYVASFKDILKNDSFFVYPQSFLEMSLSSSIDIDDYSDLERANILVKENKNETKF